MLLLATTAHAQSYPPNCAPQQQGDDATTTFCTTEYYPNPARAMLPNPNARLGHGLPNSRLTNLTDYVFASAANGGNITSIQDVYETFFPRSLSGDVANAAYAAPNYGPADNNGNYFQFGVFRTYAAGDPNQTLVLNPEGGLHFRSICSNNGLNCTQGNIWTAMIRPQFVFRPGQTLKFVFTSPAGCKHWFAMWEFSGEEISGYNTQLNQIYNAVDNAAGTAHLSYEFDTPDNFSTCYNNPASGAGQGIVDGYPYEAGGTSHSIFWPGGNNWTYENVPGFEPWELLPNTQAITAGKHVYVVSWDNTNPQESVISSFLDGSLVHQHQFDWTLNAGNPQVNGQELGMHVIVSQQTFASFTSAGLPLRQSELKDGILYELAQFDGFISKQVALKYAPLGTSNGCNGNCP